MSKKKERKKAEKKELKRALKRARKRREELNAKVAEAATATDVETVSAFDQQAVAEAFGPNPIYETMTRWQFGNRIIRVWTLVEDWTDGPDPEVSRVLGDAAPLDSSAVIARKLEEELGSKLSAVEIVDEAGDGCVFYPDWK